MPCYNEEDCIEFVVQDWVKTIRSRDLRFEFIVVNDGSRDRSKEILDNLSNKIHELQVIHQPNSGHGPALRHGLENARGDWILHIDSDNQVLASEFWKLWDQRREYEYLLGIRIKRHDALHRLIITRILCLVLYLYFGTYLRDSNIPYKLVRKQELEKLLQLIPQKVFAPSIFMSIAAAKLFRIKEVPITHLARETGTVSIVRLKLLRCCIQCVRELATFRTVLRTACRKSSIKNE